MNKLYDLHLHSKFSSDSESNPEEIVANAVNMGFRLDKRYKNKYIYSCK